MLAICILYTLSIQPLVVIYISIATIYQYVNSIDINFYIVINDIEFSYIVIQIL